jgi:hypothetical protein
MLAGVTLHKKAGALIAFLQRHKRIVGGGILLAIILCCLLLLLLKWLNLANLGNWLVDVFSTYGAGLWVCIGLAIGILLVAVTSHIVDSRSRKTENSSHDRYRLAIIAIFLTFLMILGSAALPAKSAKYIAWLPIATSLGLVWLWITEHARNLVKIRAVWLLRGSFVLLLLLYSFYGILPNRFPKDEGPLGQLDTMPTATKLQGIYTSSERAHTVDRLVEAVRLNSESGDRILAYEGLPMLYYLTDRLPSTNKTWLVEEFDRSFRESILQDMISRDRTPQLVVRATYLTIDKNWPSERRPLRWDEGEQEADPIDAYVREHFRIVDDIDGFQVMLPAR